MFPEDKQSAELNEQLARTNLHEIESELAPTPARAEYPADAVVCQCHGSDGVNVTQKLNLAP